MISQSAKYNTYLRNASMSLAKQRYRVQFDQSSNEWFLLDSKTNEVLIRGDKDEVDAKHQQIISNHYQVKQD